MSMKIFIFYTIFTATMLVAFMLFDNDLKNCKSVYEYVKQVFFNETLFLKQF